MPTVAQFDQSKLVPLVGMTANPAAAAYPELVGLLSTIYADRVAKLPWIPAGWLDSVNQYHGQPMNGVNQILVPAFTLLDNGKPTNGPVPAWLDTAEKRKAWNDLATMTRTSVMSYVNKQIIAGRAELRRVYADAAFWNFLGGLAKAVDTAINRARDYVESKTLSFLPLIGLALLGLYLFNKAKGSHGSAKRNPAGKTRRRRSRRLVRRSQRR